MAEQKNVGKRGKGKKSGRKKSGQENKSAPASNHWAYQLRDAYPERVLRRICESSGYRAAEKYAEEFGLQEAFQRLHLTPFFQKKLEQAERKENPGYVPTKQRLEIEKAQAEGPECSRGAEGPECSRGAEVKKSAESDTGRNC